MLLPGYFDIVGNGQIATLTESPGWGGLTPPVGNLTNNNLIQTNQQIQFKFEWGVYGIFAHMVNPLFEWRIEVFLEKYGPGEFSLGPVGRLSLPWSAGIVTTPTQVNFPGNIGSTTITIPPYSIPEGLYDVVAVIRLHDMPSGLPCFSAAFAEFGKIHVYREHTTI